MKASLVFILIALSAVAQTGRQLLQPDGRVGRKALVIGNDAYPGNRLHNAVNDARSMKSVLEDAGFLVQIREDTTQQQMETAIDDFTGGVNPGDIALFFYAGHGMQVTDQNYLIPVDFQARTAVDAKYKAYPAQRIQENLEAAGAAMQILVMDACRNNPFRSFRGGSDGLAAMQAGRGTYIAFATSPGKTAADNPSGKNGLFTGALVDVLKEPGLNIDQVFTRVRDRVYRISHSEQLPWSTSSVIGDFYFRASSAAAPRDLSAERELAFWNSIRDENDAALLEEYLRSYPDGAFVNIAKAKLNRLKTAASAPAASAEVASQPLKVNANSKDVQPYVPDQKQINVTDRELVRNIRRSIMDDKSLSVYAHNIKVISQNGNVTLQGRVKSDAEKNSLVAKAVALARQPGQSDRPDDGQTLEKTRARVERQADRYARF